jgi:GT2 family glycosyltransferase
MAAAIDLSIVIVNWNSREYLRKCIESIRANTRTMRYEIVVIDAASFDGCGEMLRREHPDVRFIQSDENAGFARSNNRAFAESVGAAVLFLNPDTELVGPAIDTMYAQFLTLPRVGSIGCRLLNADRTIQSSCIQALPTILNKVLDCEWLRSIWPRSVLWGVAPLFSEDSTPTAVDAISGACVLLRREAFERVGGFSEDYFMYAEDIDLAYKLLEAGYVNYYVPTATVVHYGGSSSQQAEGTFAAVMMPEATWRFFRKTRGRYYGAAYRAAMASSAIARLGLLGPLVALVSLRHGDGSRKASARKWLAVLRWSMAREDLVRQYYAAIDGQHAF